MSINRLAQVTVDLSALDHNFSIIKEKAGSAKILLVIKADAYGHGLVPVAQHLDNKTDGFAVACVNEAVELRNNGILSTIVVLQGFVNKDELALCENFNLCPMVHDYYQLEIIEQNTVISLSIWLKFDTGMGRLGFDVADQIDVLSRVAKLRNVQLVCIASHLSDSDKMSAPKNIHQKQLFDSISTNTGVKKSLLNSGGILNKDMPRYDWVRAGIMLYGISPIENRIGSDYDLKPAMALCAPLISVKTLTKGKTIGYGSTHLAKEDLKVGVVAIGYGDGFSRSLKNILPMLNYQKIRILGIISMDSLVVDLGCVDAKAGDKIIFWGKSHPVEQMANKDDIITYELLCMVSKINHKYIN
jgi:alanine racemase